MIKQQIIKLRDVVILAGILLLAMVAGSIWDYPISQQLYDSQSIFGMFFSAYGEMPIGCCLITASVLIFMGHNRERKFIGTIQIVFGVVIAIYGSIVMAIMPKRYLPFSPIINMSIGAALSVGVAIISVKLFRNADHSTMLKVALIFILVIVVQRFLIDAIKILWERPRMRMIVETPEAYFTPWWTIGSEQKDKLVAAGVGKEWFTSFPSSHTANGATAMMLTLLPLLRSKWKHKQSMFFFAGAAWGLMVALSRIILGLHFLTDTVVGFTVTLLLLIFFVQLVYKNKFMDSNNKTD